MDGAVLVTGASGYIGGRLVEGLLARGILMRAVSRSPGRLSHLAKRGVEVVAGDVMDLASLRQAVGGVNTAYYLIHSMGTSGSERTFAENDRRAAQNFVIEASNLERIVSLGGLGRPGDNLSPHLRSRLEVRRDSPGRPGTDNRLARRSGHWSRKRLVDHAPFPVAATSHYGNATLGRHAQSADRRRRRYCVFAGSARPSQNRWKLIQDRWS